MGLCYNVAIKKVGAREYWGGDSLPKSAIKANFMFLQNI
jgi:hypothetical protein